MKRAALYLRVSTVDQHPETQVHDLRLMAAQRGYEIVHEYTDRISGAKARLTEERTKGSIPTLLAKKSITRDQDKYRASPVVITRRNWEQV